MPTYKVTVTQTITYADTILVHGPEIMTTDELRQLIESRQKDVDNAAYANTDEPDDEGEWQYSGHEPNKYDLGGGAADIDLGRCTDCDEEDE